MTSNHADLRADLLETSEHIVQVLTAEARRHLGSDPSFVPGHHGEDDGAGHHAEVSERTGHGFGRG